LIEINFIKKHKAANARINHFYNSSFYSFFISEFAAKTQAADAQIKYSLLPTVVNFEIHLFS